MKVLGELRDEDMEQSLNPKVIPPSMYFEPSPRIKGVWGTGSGAAGRYTKKSDMDLWIQIDGITHQGGKYIDQDINEWLLTHDEEGYVSEGVCAYAAGECRHIDTVVVDYPPDIDACKYDLTEDLREEIDRFQGTGE